MSRLEHVLLVDEQDKPLAAAEKILAHQQGLLHRAFSIMVMRNTQAGPEYLLQQRALGKYHSPGLWTNTCCGHPRPHERTLDAANRRLFEEMGFHCPLTLLGNFCYKASLNDNLTEHEFDHVFLGQFENQTISLNPEEGKDYRWLPISTISLQLRETPQKYTAWFQQVFNLVNPTILETPSPVEAISIEAC
jgi:isopentenyl-diphosphate delta-isomerase